jgi:hypothetical protein
VVDIRNNKRITLHIGSDIHIWSGTYLNHKELLRLKVYSLGTGTIEGTHINPNKE